MSQETTEHTLPQPTAEHTRLQERVGSWDVACSFYMDPSQPPLETQGRERVEAFGQFWTIGLFETEMMGMPFQGRGTIGYDPLAEHYVTTWIDTMMPHLYVFTGKYDAAGRVLEMEGEGPDCTVAGRIARYRTREERRSADEHVFEMFMQTAGGEWVKNFTHVYRRAR